MSQKIPKVLREANSIEYVPCLFALTVYGNLDIALVCFVKKDEQQYDTYWGAYLFEEQELLADPIAVFRIDISFDQYNLEDLYKTLKILTMLLSLCFAQQKIDPFQIQEKILPVNYLLGREFDSSLFVRF